MLAVFYISGHGLGHASRAIELMGALTARHRELHIVVRTSAHPWAFDHIRGPRVEVHALNVDPGVVQIDSLHIDEDATARRAAEFYAVFDRLVAAEAEYLTHLSPALVISDIPPLAIAAADRAGIRSVAVGNFTWDWIYAGYPQFERLAPGVVETIARAYAHADKALRLPIHGGFNSMPRAVTTDIPFIARRSVRDPAGTRRLLGLEARGPIVLSSFGGYGLDLPYDRIADSGLTVIAPAHPPAGLRYEDLVAAADVVVTKPGYGIVSECVANDTAVLYTSRGRFAEYEVMVAEMPRILRCRYLEQEDLLAGRWADAIDALLRQPPPIERARVDGASVAASAILNLLE